jgi:hypothetical protein
MQISILNSLKKEGNTRSCKIGMGNITGLETCLRKEEKD